MSPNIDKPVDRYSFKVELISTVKRICVPGKGILAADESSGTIAKRLASINLENSEENRRAYRELLFSSPGLNQYISGVILFDETLVKHGMKNGPSFSKYLTDLGIVPGIKVDKGVKLLVGTDGQTTTQGHDDLDDRCKHYYELGARFAKWRAVLKIVPGGPSELAVEENARGLARYAAICQDNGIVPIVEPEILMDGDHSIEVCASVSEHVLATVFKALHDHHIILEAMLLKPNMVLAGASATKASPKAVSSYTLRTLLRTVPAAMPGIVFLSGGQSEEDATLNLNAMNAMNVKLPWFVSFSYARALQSSAIKIWDGKDQNIKAAQESLLTRAKANSQAQLGKYEGGKSTDPDANKMLFEEDYAY